MWVANISSDVAIHKILVCLNKKPFVQEVLIIGFLDLEDPRGAELLVTEVLLKLRITISSNLRFVRQDNHGHIYLRDTFLLGSVFGK